MADQNGRDLGSRTREEVAELVMRVFDRLQEQGGEFEGKPVLDAVLVVEISDPDDPIDIGGRLVPATIVLLEATTDRVTVQGGILDYAQRAIVGEGYVEGPEEGEDDDPAG